MRKTFATTIDEDLQLDFKQKCKQVDLKINEVLEALMQAYVANKISVEVKKTFTVNTISSENKK